MARPVASLWLCAGLVVASGSCSERAPTSPGEARPMGGLAVVADTPTPTRTPSPPRTPRRTPRGVKPRPVTPTPTPVPSQTLTGNWGGEHVGLSIARGGATLTYDCAHGTVDQPFVVDGNGRFDLRGTHTPESTMPPVLHPARYTGTTNGLTMTLEVTMTDTAKSAGSFALTAGAPPRLTRCR